MLSAFEAGELLSELTEARKAQLGQAAEETLKKDKRINIRLSSHDLDGLQRLALHEGMPYQTLVASILHKYVTGRLVDVNEKDKENDPPAWRFRPTRRTD